MEDKAADETDTNWRGNYSDDKTEKLTGRVGSGSIRLRVNRLLFTVLSKLHCVQIKQIPHKKSMVYSCYLIAAPGLRKK